VEPARAVNLPNTKEIIDQFEQTGDVAYWEQFIQLLGADVKTGKNLPKKDPTSAISSQESRSRKLPRNSTDRHLCGKLPISL
jgi:hypothetical protein